MNRLIASGLMFGNLVHITSPALVERYGRALEHLTGLTTDVTDFHVDISGYSPEVGDALGDHDYLNQNGVNRQFILLTTEQKSAPLLRATFSTTREMLRAFILSNEPQLFALTAKDAVAGELVDSVYDLSSPDRLFDIRTLKIEADTTRGMLRSATALADKIDTFMSQPDAWYDDVLIADMIGLSKQTGDIVRTPVKLTNLEHTQDDFHSTHFGGIYVFRTLAEPAAICVDAIPGPMPIAHVFTLDDRNRIARFFEVNGLVEPIVRARGIDGAAILSQKMDFIVVNAAQDAGLDLTGATRRDIHRLARRYASRLPEEWHALDGLVRWARDGGPWPHISSASPAYFYTLRAADTPQAGLVNMLLAELAPKDLRQLFICHKALFYTLYGTWSDTKRSYVVDFLQREYQVDKVGAREALFGHEPAMEAQPTAPGPWDRKVSDDLIDRVGPWGAVRR